MIFFQIVRASLIFWAAFMLTGADWTAIETGGRYEIEHVDREQYGRVLAIAAASFMGDAAIHRKK